MATVPKLFVAVFATASVVLVTAILIRRPPGQPLKPPKTESLTLRIDDVPADHTDNLDRNPKSIVDEVPDLRGDANTIVRRSLVPHGNDSLCATISIITSLSADDLSAQLRRTGNSHPYSYTCKFEGITPLYEDKNGADVDIIAVPGLRSHALGSWKSPYSDDVWLRDFLPKDVPNIRVLLYGYDTTLPGSLSKQSIEDLGGTLLEQIITYRASDRVHTYGQMEPYAADCPRIGTKLIHIISRYRLTKLASRLLQDCGEIGALVNVQDSWSRTPLSWAAVKGHETVVRLLLDTGKVDVDARDKNARSPLSWAAEKGRKAVVKLLLDIGNVDVDSRDKNDRMLLSWAAEKENEVVVKLLLDIGKVSIDSRD